MASVFAQQYKPVEIVVVDDGSTDNTQELMATYGDRIRYFWQENRGIASARTNGCRLARGELIAFQDDDDLMPSDRIVVLYEALREHPSAALALGDWAVMNGDGNLSGQRSRVNIHVDNEEPILINDGYKAVLWPKVTPVPHTTLFRKADGDRIGWFDTRFFHACEDTDFFARCGKLGPIVYVPKVVSFYRREHGSLYSNSVLLTYSRLLLFEKHLTTMEAEQKDLRKRLQFRMLQSLKQLAVYQSKGLKPPDSVSGDHLNRCLSLLGLRDHLAYTWLTLIKLPIRSLILRRD